MVPAPGGPRRHPEGDRQRIVTNRDDPAPAIIDAAAPYPETLVQSSSTAPGQAEVTVSSIAGPDRQITEQTIISPSTCCLDASSGSGASWRSTSVCSFPTA